MSSYNSTTTGVTLIHDFPSQVLGKTFLVTGPSLGGIGAETAISLAHGSPSTILLLGRSLSKIQPTIDTIHSISPSTLTKFVSINLDSLASVREAARKILEDKDIGNIDVIINNAAIMVCPYTLTEDGYESQFAVNYLSHFLLTNLLMPKLLAAQNPRVVNVSSWAHVRSDIRWDDIGFQNGEAYQEWEAYGQAKTANILFSVALNQKLGKRGVKSFALHPGSIRSNLQVHLTPEILADGVANRTKMGLPMPASKSLQQGCATTLRAALDPNLKAVGGSVYLHDCQVIKPDEKDLMAWTLDEGSAERLWEVSEEMVGEKFGF